MKLFEEQIITGQQLFVVKEERFPYNDFPLHVHPEYELILVMKSSGERYVGNCIANFEDGDLCLFGPNLPHTFYNKHLPGNRAVHQIVVQFRENFLGDGFFDRPQFTAIRQLLDRSRYGLTFPGPVREAVQAKLQAMVASDEVESIAGMLSVLNLLSHANDYTVLSTESLSAADSIKYTERMYRVYHFLLDHFKRDIQLSEVANVAHLSPAAFCRYFKKHTRKNLSEFVNDLRIHYACKLLAEQELSMLQVCYESGFNNVSYFNRQFKARMRVSPLKYKQQKGFVH